ncbi:RrF2 family transcriptional regulator [Salinispora arenicola]|uniref:RrF2 family transcriptional regulator n=1 Tax=Salinispora arenicola TaxID=168697 RepID=UPI0027DAEC47|nr:Rrf2 family transcriptional regulator [Salinispora arenicola]
MAVALRRDPGTTRRGLHRIGGTTRAVLRPPGALSRQAATGARQGRRPGRDDRSTGGFRLAQPASEITLLRIVEAVGGTSPPYVCREIRQQGQGALPADECQNMCVLAEKMTEAHEAWRRSLAGVSLADIVASLPPTAPARTRSRLTSTISAAPSRPSPSAP